MLIKNTFRASQPVSSASGILAAILAFTAPSQALAGTIVCSGTVDVLSYHADGAFMFKLSSMNNPVFFCNADSEWVVAGTPYKTSAETCKMLYATLLSAKATGKPLTNVYLDGDEVPSACNGWGDWKHVNIRHYQY